MSAREVETPLVGISGAKGQSTRDDKANFTAHCPSQARLIMLDFAKRASSAFHRDYFLAMADKAIGTQPTEAIDARLHAIRRQWFSFEIAGGTR